MTGYSAVYVLEIAKKYFQFLMKILAEMVRAGAVLSILAAGSMTEKIDKTEKDQTENKVKLISLVKDNGKYDLKIEQVDKIKEKMECGQLVLIKDIKISEDSQHSQNEQTSQHEQNRYILLAPSNNIRENELCTFAYKENDNLEQNEKYEILADFREEIDKKEETRYTTKKEEKEIRKRFAESAEYLESLMHVVARCLLENELNRTHYKYKQAFRNFLDGLEEYQINNGHLIRKKIRKKEIKNLINKKVHTKYIKRIGKVKEKIKHREFPEETNWVLLEYMANKSTEHKSIQSTTELIERSFEKDENYYIIYKNKITYALLVHIYELLSRVKEEIAHISNYLAYTKVWKHPLTAKWIAGESSIDTYILISYIGEDRKTVTKKIEGNILNIARIVDAVCIEDIDKITEIYVCRLYPLISLTKWIRVITECAETVRKFFIKG